MKYIIIYFLYKEVIFDRFIPLALPINGCDNLTPFLFTVIDSNSTQETSSTNSSGELLSSNVILIK